MTNAAEPVNLVERRQVRTVQADRAETFRRLAGEHLEGAYSLARAILRNSMEAEDATHDAFEQAWRRWSTLRDRDRFQAWFHRILVNTCRNRLRSSRRVVLVSVDEAARRPIADGVAGSDSRLALERALEQLSPEHRIVVALRYFADLPITEVAARTGLPEGTVSSRLHYALLRLQDALAAGGAEEVRR